MIRAVFYIGLVLVLSAGVYLKIGVVKEKRSAPTISIGKEHERHGKPVEVYKVRKGDMRFYERVTGTYSNMKVEMFVSKIQWTEIKIGQKVRVVNENGAKTGGKVSWRTRNPDSETGLYKIIAVVEEPLLGADGKNVVVDVNTQTFKGVLSVPSAAVEKEGKDSYVWILKGGKVAQKRTVREGRESEMFTQILEGLKINERIIVRGASALEKGDVARVVKGGERQ